MSKTLWVGHCLLGLLAGCSAIKHGAIPAVDSNMPARFTFEVKDSPDRKEFILRVVSEDDRDLCLPIEEWPNKTGQLSAGVDRAQVRLSTGELRQMLSGISMYCPGGCGTVRIGARSVLASAVSYDVFGLWQEAEISDRKILEMEVVPSVCK
jgi:hypothetical protein